MITLILGGARSGKSAYAERAAIEKGGRVVYLATAEACDAEMAARIALHRERRCAAWETWEGEPQTLPETIEAYAAESCTLLLDCMTVWLSRLALAQEDPDDEGVWRAREDEILALLQKVLDAAAASPASLIVVSNEVGFSLVPPHRLGRRFRDLQGRANQLAASMANEAVLVVAGLPVKLK